MPQYGLRLVVFLVLVIFMFKAGPFLFGPFGKMFTALSYPFIKQSSELSATVGQRAGMFRTADQLLTQNAELRQKNKELENRLALVAACQAENEELRIAVGLLPPGGAGRLFRVLAGPGAAGYDTLLLDQKSAKIPAVLGQKVLLVDGALIGEIVSADSRLAKVRLFSSYGLEVPVAIGENNWPGVATGRGGGNYLVRLARGVDIKQGENIRATLLGGRALGIVGQIDKKPSETYQDVYFKVPTNIYQLSWVSVEND